MIITIIISIYPADSQDNAKSVKLRRKIYNQQAIASNSFRRYQDIAESVISFCFLFDNMTKFRAAC